MVVVMNSRAGAQSEPMYAHTEVFGGFSTLNVGGGNRTALYGWQAGMTTNFNRRFGILTEFAGQSKNGISIRQSLIGPQFNRRSNTRTTFIHSLFGVSRFAGANAFTIGIGGGLDVRAGTRFVIRLAQVDWLPTRHGGAWST